jgi:hypothetical protein
MFPVVESVKVALGHQRIAVFVVVHTAKQLEHCSASPLVHLLVQAHITEKMALSLLIADECNLAADSQVWGATDFVMEIIDTLPMAVFGYNMHTCALIGVADVTDLASVIGLFEKCELQASAPQPAGIDASSIVVVAGTHDETVSSLRQQFMRAAITGTTIVHIHLSYVLLNETCIHLLLRGLGCNSSLKFFAISACGLTDELLEQLGPITQRTQYLDISNNPSLQSPYFPHILIARGETLVHLDISGLDLAPESMRLLASIIPVSLQTLTANYTCKQLSHRVMFLKCLHTLVQNAALLTSISCITDPRLTSDDIDYIRHGGVVSSVPTGRILHIKAA